ncbi:hypothetical protein CLOBOL_06531 [Enterocloster bolteae ATCC BAA-613]|uniref:Uncharacterized protein n=1 Tax=Enterocloster bolteae (strain ATCC BAA-613 / DSM 15670 / CCUG 46953 / JCM 12243 / WAL 16351) TaxID=411902 RepID=A8S389_ENTBW|nr:hypothetical protein CLOBOL_06531 [Enterocloster bolteae ATCC BAA-613]
MFDGKGGCPAPSSCCGLLLKHILEGLGVTALPGSDP